MEQKKILWVVLSMSAFFAIIFGVAVYLYAPSRTQSVAVSSDGSGFDINRDSDLSTVDPDMWTRNPDSIPSFKDEHDRNVINGNITNNITFVNGDAGLQESKSLDVTDLTDEDTTEKVSGELPEELAKQLSIPSSAEKQPIKEEVKPAVPVKQKAAVSKPVKTQAKKAEPERENPPAKSIAKPKTQVKKPEVKPVKKTTETLYWVQTASLTSRLNAEKARDALAARHMKVEIFTKETAIGLTHRVRVGPFRNNSEAEYWLKNIKEIKGFEGSYISQERVKS